MSRQSYIVQFRYLLGTYYCLQHANAKNTRNIPKLDQVTRFLKLSCFQDRSPGKTSPVPYRDTPFPCLPWKPGVDRPDSCRLEPGAPYSLSSSSGAWKSYRYMFLCSSRRDIYRRNICPRKIKPGSLVRFVGSRDSDIHGPRT